MFAFRSRFIDMKKKFLFKILKNKQLFRVFVTMCHKE